MQSSISIFFLLGIIIATSIIFRSGAVPTNEIDCTSHLTCKNAKCARDFTCLMHSEKTCTGESPCYPVPVCLHQDCPRCSLSTCGSEEVCIMEETDCEGTNHCCSRPLCIKPQNPTQCFTVKCSAGHVCAVGNASCSSPPCACGASCPEDPCLCYREACQDNYYCQHYQATDSSGACSPLRAICRYSGSVY